MCFAEIATIASALGSAGAAAAPTAVTAIGAPLGPAMSLASGASAISTSQLITALSSGSFAVNTGLQLLGFGAQAKQAKLMGQVAQREAQAVAAQVNERKRQEKIRSQIETINLARNAAVGISKTKTMASAQGLAGVDDRVIDFANRADEMAGLEKTQLDMRLASLNETRLQSARRLDAALAEARSATSPEAFLGLGANIAGGFFDSYRAFGALPFESPTTYSERVMRGLS